MDEVPQARLERARCSAPARRASAATFRSSSSRARSERLALDVAASQDHDVEDVVDESACSTSCEFCSALNDGRPSSSSATISPSITVSSGQLREAPDDGGIPDAEVVVVAGAQMNPAAGLERDGAVAVELQLIFPAGRFVRERIRAEEQHRLDEGCLDSLDHQRSSSGLCRSCPGKSAFHIDVARYATRTWGPPSGGPASPANAIFVTV